MKLIEIVMKKSEKGVEIANVTLHVGIGTFRPVKVENVEEHKMHSEHFYVKQSEADKINKTVEKEYNESIQGMIKVVEHLVTVEEK